MSSFTALIAGTMLSVNLTAKKCTVVSDERTLGDVTTFDVDTHSTCFRAKAIVAMLFLLALCFLVATISGLVGKKRKAAGKVPKIPDSMMVVQPVPV